MKTIVIYSLSLVYLLLSLRIDSIGIMGIYIVVSISLFFWGNYERLKVVKKRKEEVEREREEMLRDIVHTHSVVSGDSLQALMLDENLHLFFYAEKEEEDEPFQVKKFTFSQVLEVAILEDGELLTIHPKDGVISGEIEMDKETDKELDEEYEEIEDDVEDSPILSLLIAVDDLSTPILEFIFVEEDPPTEEEYEEILEECRAWYQKMNVIIRRNERQRKKS